MLARNYELIELSTHRRVDVRASSSFTSLYSHGFVRVAVCAPRVEVAAPAANASAVLAMAEQAVAKRAVLALFPELGISSYAIEDLTLQDALLDAVEIAVDTLLAASRTLPAVLIVGAPVRAERRPPRMADISAAIEVLSRPILCPPPPLATVFFE